MGPNKEHQPYNLMKKKLKTGTYWYARFWNEATKEYDTVRATGILVEGKRERKKEAEAAADTLFAEMLKEAERLRQEAEALEENKVCNVPFIEYLRDFWTPDSKYAKHKSGVKKQPLSAYYIKMNRADVERHIATYPDFQNITLGQLSKKMIKEWLIWMSDKKAVHKKRDGSFTLGKPLSGKRINNVLQGMRVAVRWAVDDADLDADPFYKIDEATETPKKIGVMTAEELDKLLYSPIKDPFNRLAILLGAMCGMRRGEIRGLKWGDIDEEKDLIIIQHNYVNGDGLKSPKIKGGTIVENSNPFPLLEEVKRVLKIVRKFSKFTGDDDYVIQSKYSKRIGDSGQPVSAEYFRSVLIRELASIGIDEETRKKRNIRFHSLRHTFVTVGRLSGMTDFEIQTLARHKTKEMMDNYSHGKEAIDFMEMKKKMDMRTRKPAVSIPDFPKAVGDDVGGRE